MVVVTGKSKPVAEDIEPEHFSYDDAIQPALRICDIIQKICTNEGVNKDALNWEVKIKKNGQLGLLDEKSRYWYDRAFGKKRNEMKVSFTWIEGG